MSSVARGQRPAPAGPAGPHLVPHPSGTPAAPAPDPLPGALERHRQRVLAAVLDVARLTLTAFVGRFAQRLCRQPHDATLAAVEAELRDALLALGAAVLGEVVRLRGTGFCGSSYVCPCGVRLVLKEIAPLQQRTWFGTITLERAVYVPAAGAAAASCRVHAHRVPLDAAWGLLAAAPPEGTPEGPEAAEAGAGVAALPDPDGGTLAPVAPGPGPARLAPGFAAVVVEFGARLPYAEAARLLGLAFGALGHLAPNTIRAYTRAAGRAREQQERREVAHAVRSQPPTRGQVRAVVETPLGARPATAPDTLVVSLDGALERTRDGWKEVKLGAVSALAAPAASAPLVPPAAAARPVLGPTTYTATLAPAEAFGRQLLATAQRRGLGWARRVVVLGDGAKWIWKLAARRFLGAIEIVDWYHARAHLWALAQRLYGEGTAAAWTWLETLAGELWTAQTAADVAIVAAAAEVAWATPRKDLPDGAPRRTQARHREVTTAVAYFTANARRLRYGAFRAQGLPVGSGVVEGGCHTVLHLRLKCPGARWDAESAEAMARARAVLCSDPAPSCHHPHDRLAA